MISSIIGFILLVLAVVCVWLAAFASIGAWIVGVIGFAALVTTVIALWHVAARGVHRLRRV